MAVGRGSLVFLRAAVALQTALVFLSPVTAGVMLSAPEWHLLHSAASYGLFAAALVHLAAAVLVWRPGGGPPGPALSALVFLGGVLAQVGLGVAGVPALHVPLGVLLFAASVLQLCRVWGVLGRPRLTIGAGASSV